MGMRQNDRRYVPFANLENNADFVIDIPCSCDLQPLKRICHIEVIRLLPVLPVFPAPESTMDVTNPFCLSMTSL